MRTSFCDMGQNYRICHEIKRPFQTFSLVEKCKLLIIKCLNASTFQTFCWKSPEILLFLNKYVAYNQQFFAKSVAYNQQLRQGKGLHPNSGFA